MVASIQRAEDGGIDAPVPAAMVHAERIPAEHRLLSETVATRRLRALLAA